MRLSPRIRLLMILGCLGVAAGWVAVSLYQRNPSPGSPRRPHVDRQPAAATQYLPSEEAPSIMLRGRITTWDKKVLSRGWLWLNGTDSSKIEVSLDEQGTFMARIPESLIGDRLRVRAGALGYGPSEVMKLDVTTLPEQVLFKLPPGGKVSGVVLDRETGKVVPRARVDLRPYESNSSALIETAASAAGVFSFDCVPEGACAVFAGGEGYVYEAHLKRLEVHGGEQVENIVLSLRKGWMIQGTVTDPAGIPIAGAEIEVREDIYRYFGTSSQDGHFLVSGIIPDSRFAPGFPGIDRFTCKASGSASVELEDVAPGSSLRIVMAKPGVVEITMTLAEGTDPKEFHWSASSMLKQADEALENAAEPQLVIRTATGEKARLVDLVPGFYDVAVMAVGRKSVEFKNVHVSPGEVLQLHAILVPGRSTGQFVALPLNATDAASLRKQLEEVYAGLSLDDRKALRESLLELRDRFPKDGEEFKLLDEALREP